MVEVIIEFEGFGQIKAQLFNDTPNSTANFVSLAKNGFYNGLTLHRIIPNFVAQGGCPEGSGMGGPGYSIDGEFAANGFTNDHKHVKGTLSWARSMARNSAGSQFFICLDETPHLDGEYAAFGQVVEGLEILDELNKIGTNSGTPTKNVIIKSVEVNTNGINVPEVVKV